MRLGHTARSGESALEGGLASSREIVAGGGRESGGASRDRTGDLLVANQTLSQLSYGPVTVSACPGSGPGHAMP